MPGLALLLAFALGLAETGIAADPPRAEIAILKSADITAYNEAVAGFKETSPQSFSFLEYSAGGDFSEARKLARKIRASDAKLVLAVGLKAALAAKLEVIDIPIILCMVLDPRKYELTAPNMTGVLLEIPEARQLRTVREIMPRAKRIGVLYDPEKTGRRVEEARRQARDLGLELVAQEVRSKKEVPGGLQSILPSIDILWLVPDNTVLSEESLGFILRRTLDANVPVMGFSDDLVRSGALLAHYVDYQKVGRQAGVLAREILNGRTSVPHALMPPKEVSLAVNLKTAQFLGIQIPPSVIRRANLVH